MKNDDGRNERRDDGDQRNSRRERFMPHTIARVLIRGMFLTGEPHSRVREIFTCALREVRSCSEQELLDLVYANGNGTPVGEILLEVSDDKPVGERMRAGELLLKIAAGVVVETVFFLLGQEAVRSSSGSGKDGERPALTAVPGGKTS